MMDIEKYLSAWEVTSKRHHWIEEYAFTTDKGAIMYLGWHRSQLSYLSYRVAYVGEVVWC